MTVWRCCASGSKWPVAGDGRISGGGHEPASWAAAARRPRAGRLRVGVIGCGKFAGMFLAQAPPRPACRWSAIADLAPDRGAREAGRASAGRTSDRGRFGRGRAPRRGTWLTDDARAVVGCAEVEVVVEATGDARRRRRARAARRSTPASTSSWSMSRPTCCAGRRWRGGAAGAGVVYSLAYGDQPALIAEQVDWARACGLRGDRRRQGHQVPAGLSPLDAGHGLGPLRPHRRARGRRRHEPARCSTPSSTAPSRRSRWRRWPTPPGWRRPADGLAFPPCGVDDLPLRAAPGRRPAAQLDAAGHGRGRLLARARRPAGLPRPALGRLRRVRGADATTSRAASPSTALVTRPVRPLRRAVPALPPDRAGARHQRRLGRPARRADRRADRLARRRRRHGQARPRRRRDARRRGRPLRLRPPRAGADARSAEAAAADRARPTGAAAPAGGGRTRC